MPVIIPPSSSLARVAQECRDDNKKEDNRWSNMPDELLRYVHVHYNNYYRFRATCTAWRSVAPPLQLKPSYALYQSPCLLLQTQSKTFEFFNPLYNITYRPTQLLPRTIIYSFGHGWLLMGVKNSDDIFFLNPFNGVKIKVPDKPSNVRFGKMCFSSAPTSSHCRIIGVSMLSRLLKFGIIKRGEESWTIEKITSYPQYPSVCDLVMHNGQCYCTDREGNLGVFNPHDVRGSWRMYRQWPLPRKYLTTLRGNFLVEGNGEILWVIVLSGATRCPGGGNRRTRVYKLNVSEMTWERVEDLGNRMLYVSNATSISTISTVPGMGNKIYFPYFHNKDGVFYSLATKAYHAYGDNLDEKPRRLEQLEEYRWTTWVLPQFGSTIEDDFKW